MRFALTIGILSLILLVAGLSFYGKKGENDYRAPISGLTQTSSTEHELYTCTGKDVDEVCEKRWVGVDQYVNKAGVTFFVARFIENGACLGLFETTPGTCSLDGPRDAIPGNQTWGAATSTFEDVMGNEFRIGKPHALQLVPR